MTAPKNPNPRTTERGAQRAAQSRARTDASAAKLAALKNRDAEAAAAAERTLSEALAEISTDTSTPAATSALADAIKSGEVDFSDAVVSILTGKKSVAAKTTKRATKLVAVPDTAPTVGIATRAKKGSVEDLLATLSIAESLLDPKDRSWVRETTTKRDALIVKCIEAGAALGKIAEARGVKYSTNRDLVRLIQTGQRYPS